MAMLRQRIIDLAEIDRLIKPHTGMFPVATLAWLVLSMYQP